MTSLPPVRLIASDLDGTLFGEDGHLSDRTIAAVQAADAAGITVVAATGRSHRTAAPRLAPAEVIRTAVCSNGGSVYDFDAARIVLHRPIADGVLAEVLDATRAAHPEVRFGWETDEGFGWERDFIDLAPVHVRIDFDAGNRADELHDSIDDVGPTKLTKLLVGHPVHAQNDWLQRLAPILPSAVRASTSGAAFVEVTGDGVDKATTLALVCAEWGIDPDEVAVFGDQSNDVAMLEWAGRSWAPANAHPSAVDAAHARAGHHAEDGIAEVIESLLA